MATPYGQNWACKALRRKIDANASAQEVADALTSHPRLLAIIQEALDNPPEPGSFGGDQAESIVGSLSMALVEETGHPF